MKFFLKLFLILFVSNASAARDLQQEAFDVLAESVQLKENAVLNQGNFKPAIKSLTTFLRGRYPELKPKPIPPKQVTKPTKQNKIPVIKIRQARAGDYMSPEISISLQDHNKFDIFSISEPYSWKFENYFCRANIVPLFCAMGIYFHLRTENKVLQDKQEHNLEQITQQMRIDAQDRGYIQFNNLLLDFIKHNDLTSKHLNTLYQIEFDNNGQKIIVETTLAGIYFRFGYEFGVRNCLKKGGNPLVIGSITTPNEFDSNHLETITAPVGMLSLFNIVKKQAIPDIIKLYPDFENYVQKIDGEWNEKYN